jgi:hypothetical protein
MVGSALHDMVNKDTTVIPPGGYCYRVVRLRPNEILSEDVERFKKNLREYLFTPGWKEVLCPYWLRTDYGMVRCDFLEVESLDEDDPNAMEKALKHFSSEDAFRKANRYSLLYDEIKICDVRIDEAEEWINNL